MRRAAHRAARRHPGCGHCDPSSTVWRASAASPGGPRTPAAGSRSRPSDPTPPSIACSLASRGLATRRARSSGWSGSPCAGAPPTISPSSRARARASGRSRSPRTSRPARSAGGRRAIPPTAASATPSRAAAPAGRASRSRASSPTSARAPAWTLRLVRRLPPRVHDAGRAPTPRRDERMPRMWSPSAPRDAAGAHARAGCGRAGGGRAAAAGRRRARRARDRRLPPRRRRHGSRSRRAPARAQAPAPQALRRDGARSRCGAGPGARVAGRGGAARLSRGAHRAAAAPARRRRGRRRGAGSPLDRSAASLHAIASAAARRDPAAARDDLRQPLGRADRLRCRRGGGAPRGPGRTASCTTIGRSSRPATIRWCASSTDRPCLLRRSRGYVPRPLPLPRPSPHTLLACGAQLASTFCLARGERAWLSQHLGDLDSPEAAQGYARAVERMERWLGTRAEVVAHDLHPHYASTRYALLARGRAPRRRAAPSRARGVRDRRARAGGTGARRGLRRHRPRP